MVGMLSHIDASRHRWFSDYRWYDLRAILDDANTEIYYPQPVEEESTRTVMAGLNPKAGEKVDKHRLTQVGRALRELGVQMIPAYSPAGQGAVGEELWDLARKAAARTASGWHPHGGGGESVSAGALYRGV